MDQCAVTSERDSSVMASLPIPFPEIPSMLYGLGRMVFAAGRSVRNQTTKTVHLKCVKAGIIIESGLRGGPSSHDTSQTNKSGPPA
ncbi:hypothetical protein AOLI_G00252450 [Acnodon oligacanthus]